MVIINTMRKLMMVKKGHDRKDDARIRLPMAIYVQTCNCTSRDNYVKV